MNKPHFFIGSLPFQSVEKAIAFVSEHSSHLPFLPQLPELNPQEDMIGQVLRGIELGFWDEKASCALELFQNEFVDFPKYKIQIAGPFTVGRSASTPFTQLAPHWLRFFRGLRKQLAEAAFVGELWLQIDEPFFSKENPLPDGYTAFLQEVKLVCGKSSKLGIHSCATLRPEIFIDHQKMIDFYSFDFTKAPETDLEVEYWTPLLEKQEKQLVLGLLEPQRRGSANSIEKLPNTWVSATCGLSGWSELEIEDCLGAYR